MVAYFAALDPMTLVRALPGNVAQGLMHKTVICSLFV